VLTQWTLSAAVYDLTYSPIYFAHPAIRPSISRPISHKRLSAKVNQIAIRSGHCDSPSCIQLASARYAACAIQACHALVQLAC